MALFFAKLLISTMAIFMLVSASLATSAVPLMKVHKKATYYRFPTGEERVVVSYDICNQGSSTAYDVSLNDTSWDEATFEVVRGNTSKSWERLDAGGTLSHSFLLEAKVKGLFYGAPSVVTFRFPTKPGLRQVYSTPILPLHIVADRPPIDKFSLKSQAKRIFLKYSQFVQGPTQKILGKL